jgi:MraZ protein
MGGTFHGATVITLDAKGRLAIPTRHREALVAASRTLVLTAHPEGCALIYPESAWERVRSQVEKFPSFHPQASWWKRLLLGFEEHLAPDSSGRILVSPALRRHASLERDAMMLGQGQYFELWDDALRRAKLEKDLASGRGVPPGMENFSL